MHFSKITGRQTITQEMETDENLSHFCTVCGTLITIGYQGKMYCPLCKKEYPVSSFEHSERNIVLKALKPQIEASENQGDDDNMHGRSIIGERCPKCDHEGLYFSTAQLRSADEGMTIFYECPECGYKYSINS